MKKLKKFFRKIWGKLYMNEARKKIDPERILAGMNSSSYSQIRFIVFSSESFSKNFTLEKLKKIKTRIQNIRENCFGELPEMIQKFPKWFGKFPNRILYVLNFEKHSVVKLSYEERKAWVNLCKKHKLLPAYVRNYFVRTGNLVLRFENVEITRLYLYLVVARYLEEEPFFVRTLLYLVQEVGLDFYLAVSVATTCCNTNIGHSILNLSRQWRCAGKDFDFFSIQNFDISMARALYRFVHSTDDYEKLLLTAAVSCSFGLHISIGKFKNSALFSSGENILDKKWEEEIYRNDESKRNDKKKSTS